MFWHVDSRTKHDPAANSRITKPWSSAGHTLTPPGGGGDLERKGTAQLSPHTDKPLILLRAGGQPTCLVARFPGMGWMQHNLRRTLPFPLPACVRLSRGCRQGQAGGTVLSPCSFWALRLHLHGAHSHSCHVLRRMRSLAVPLLQCYGHWVGCSRMHCDMYSTS